MEDPTVTLLRAVMDGKPAQLLGVLHFALACAAGVLVGITTASLIAAVGAGTLALFVMYACFLGRWTAWVPCLLGAAGAVAAGGSVGALLGRLVGWTEPGAVAACAAPFAVVALALTLWGYSRLLGELSRASGRRRARG